jgi:hypothetical protein
VARSRTMALLVTAVIIFSVTGGPTVSAAPAAGAASQARTQSRDAAAGIASVAADTWTITVSGSLPSTDAAATALEIYELDPTQDPSAYNGAVPVARVAAPATTPFRVSFPRFSGTRDRYYSKFLAVTRTGGTTSPLGVPRY